MGGRGQIGSVCTRDRIAVGPSASERRASFLVPNHALMPGSDSLTRRWCLSCAAPALQRGAARGLLSNCSVTPGPFLEAPKETIFVSLKFREYWLSGLRRTQLTGVL